jgi:hypothetical protein
MKSAAKVRNPPLMSDVAHDPLLPFDDCLNAATQLSHCGSLSVVKSRVLGSVSSGSVVLYEVRDYPAS